MTGPAISGQQIRATLLQVVTEHAQEGSSFQTNSVLRDVATRLGLKGQRDAEQALLTAWGDLFRQGHLSWGYNLDNPGPPFCHLTEQGRRILQTFGRDPANPRGYMAHLAAYGPVNAVAESYIREALETYNNNCFKATAVMVGAASESTILELRDTIVARLQQHQRNPSAKLTDWRIKRVIDGINAQIQTHRQQMPNELRDAFDAYWPAFVQQIRTARNDAGHPSNIDPVTPETVHGSLLVFHELARLGRQLKAWVHAHMP